MKARLRWDGTERVCRERERAVGKTRERQGHEEKRIYACGEWDSNALATNKRASKRNNETTKKKTPRKKKNSHQPKPSNSPHKFSPSPQVHTTHNTASQLVFDTPLIATTTTRIVVLLPTATVVVVVMTNWPPFLQE